MAAPTDLDFLLIGRAGCGKSRTGNSILKRNAFLFKAGLNPVTTEIKHEVSGYKGRIIKVADCPGVGDTDNEEDVKLVVESMANAIKTNPSGYHAFLLVVRFGGRFTKQDIDTVQLLKNIFGEDVVKNFCILIMTCGDVFEAEDTEETFQQWCQNQEGVFKQLIQECQGRVALFNNATKDEFEKDAQLDRLLELVESLASQGRKYCEEDFQKSHKTREKCLVESKKHVLQENIGPEISLIKQKLVKLSGDQETENQIGELEKLLEQADVVSRKVEDEDKNTGALHELQVNIETVQTMIREAIKVHEKKEKELLTLKQQEIDMKEKMEQKAEAEKKRLQFMMGEEKRKLEETLKHEEALSQQRRDEEEKKTQESQKRHEDKMKNLTEELETLKHQALAFDDQRSADRSIWKHLCTVL